MATSLTRQITLRLPEPLYRRVRQLAKKKNISINKLAQESLEGLAQKILEHEMQAAYGALALDTGEREVEIYLSAQSEVVSREPA